MRLRLVAVAVLLSVMGASVVFAAETAAALLQRGIYREETVGDVQGAAQIYEQVIQNSEATRGTLAQAHFRLASCYLKLGDKVAASRELQTLLDRYPGQGDLTDKAQSLLDGLVMPDPASLMPADTVIYWQVGSPGEQVEKLLQMLAGDAQQNPTQVLGDAGMTLPHAVSAMLNPSMIQELKKLRGYALGIGAPTGSGIPPFVAVLYPGESDAVRGFIEMPLRAAGRPQPPLEGMTRMDIAGPQGMVIGVALDKNAIILAAPLQRLEWVVRQYKGLQAEPALADSSAAFARLDATQRRKNASTLWLDVARLYPAVRQIMVQAGQGDKLAAIEALIDPASISEVTCRDVMDPRGPYSETTITLREGHHALVYDMVRTPHLNKAAFGAVPSDAFLVASLALGEAGDGGAQAEAAQQAVQRLTGLDVGREIFANIEQVMFFVVPPDPASLSSPAVKNMPLVGGIGIVVTSRDPGKTQTLLRTLLSVPGTVMSQMGVAQPVAAEGQYTIALQNGQPVSVYMRQAGNATVLALANGPAAGVVKAVQSGHSALTTGALSAPLGNLPEDASKVLVVDVAGLVSALRDVAAVQGAPEEATALLGKLAETVQGASLYVRTAEAENQITIRSGFENLPPLAPVISVIGQVVGMMQQGNRGQAFVQTPAPEPVGIVHILGRITIDGDLKDWAGVAPMGLPLTGATTSAVRLAWGEDGLYAALDAPDADIAIVPDQLYRGDAFEIFVDKDLSRAAWFEGNPSAQQYFFAAQPDKGPGPALVTIAYGPDRSLTGKVQAAWQRRQGGYTIEVLIPAELLGPSPMEADRVIGLNFAWESGGRPVEQFFADKDSNSSWGTPANWGAVRLAGAGAPAGAAATQ